uniref:Uncharacterized protein n=1 Tax=Knipowitschia caucasica TaxID=637954 RepID=A0AAV2JD36_KNICA
MPGHVNLARCREVLQINDEERSAGESRHRSPLPAALSSHLAFMSQPVGSRSHFYAPLLQGWTDDGFFNQRRLRQREDWKLAPGIALMATPRPDAFTGYHRGMNCDPGAAV